MIAVLSAAPALPSRGKCCAGYSMLETLKADASEGTMVQETRYRHRRGYRYVKSQNCWWGDRCYAGISGRA